MSNFKSDIIILYTYIYHGQEVYSSDITPELKEDIEDIPWGLQVQAQGVHSEHH